MFGYSPRAAPCKISRHDVQPAHMGSVNSFVSQASECRSCLGKRIGSLMSYPAATFKHVWSTEK
eukprot:748936-Rhodomonas_salina.1